MYYDATETLRSCQSEMDKGEMLMEKGFTLEKAMAAMELMDPKMDSGMSQRPKTDITELNLPTSDLSPLQLNAILQKLSDYVTTWHAGHPMALTVFRCMYAHDAIVSKLKKDSDDRNAIVLSTAILATLKLCANIDYGVIGADIYEEEDFYPDTRMDPKGRNGYAWWTPDNVNDREILGKLHEVSRLLLTIQKKDDDGYQDMRNRIDMLRLLFEIQDKLLNKDHIDLKRACELIDDALATLCMINTTSSESIPSYVFDEDLVYAKALLGQAPPRTIKIPKNPTEALQTRLKRLRLVCKLFEDEKKCDIYWMLRFVDQITSSPRVSIYVRSSIIHAVRRFDRRNSFKYVLDALVQFGVPQACLLASLPSTNLEASKIPPIAQINVRSETTRVSSDQVSQEVRGFIRSTQKVIFSMFCLRCLTRCKQIERISILFKDFSGLQDHADYVDAAIDVHNGKPIHSTRSFGLWVVLQSMDHMVRYLLLGLELELYADWELTYVFWYMDYLLGTMAKYHNQRLSLIQRQKQLVFKTLETMKTNKKKSKKKKKKKKKGKKKSKQQNEELLFKEALGATKQNNRTVQFDFEAMKLQTFRAMCRGMFHFLAALKIQEVAPQPPKQSLLDMKTCFEKRFEVFQNLRQPQMLSYDGFLQACDLSKLEGRNNNERTFILLKSAAEWFDTAKKHCEKIMSSRSRLPEDIDLSEMKSVMKTIVANCVSITRISRHLESPGDKKMSKKCKVSYDYHPSWCVLSVRFV